MGDGERLRNTGARRLLAATGVLAALVGLIGAPQAVPATPPGARDVTATLFQWSFDSVARECTTSLGPKGYGYVEVSPASEHIRGPQWWTSYQPVSYRIAGRPGNRTSFKNMVDTCHRAGVKVVADAVINHMSAGAGTGTGTGGSSYSKYDYPGYYSNNDFHSCRRNISSYADRDDVQTCELVGLADLDTGADHVRGRIAAYLNGLLALGVDGFRIDAAKHMAATDLAAVKSKLSNPDAFWVHEVIYGEGEAVQPTEYTGSGDVDEFRYAYDIKRIFTEGKLAQLRTIGASRGYLPSDQARSFVDNWDTERNGKTLSYKDGSTYTLANVFMLAHPYGAPNVYSGYQWTDRDAGPPNGGMVDASSRDGWNRQHRRRQIANMVGFRNAVAGSDVRHWWDNGNNALAFGRGNKGFVVINHEGFAIRRTFQTSLPAGTYCDVQHSDPGPRCRTKYIVGSHGRFTATVGAGDALALY